MSYLPPTRDLRVRFDTAQALTRLFYREQAVVLANALADLPADYREVIILRHFQELSFSEIADHMGRTLDSVKNTWARAIRKLKELIADSESS